MGEDTTWIRSGNLYKLPNPCGPDCVLVEGMVDVAAILFIEYEGIGVHAQ